MMTKHTAITLFTFCVLFFLSFNVVAEQVNANNNNNEPRFSAKKLWQDSYGLLTGSTKKYIEILGIAVNQAKTFFPPSLDFRNTKDEDDEQRLKDAAKTEKAASGGGGGAGDKVKYAAEKSFKSTKGVVEDSAKSAANIVGEAVHKTADKMKKTAHGHESKNEL